MSTNLSKQRRQKLEEEIRQLRTYLSAAAQTGETGRLLGYLSDLEEEICGKKFGLVFEEHWEEMDQLLADHAPILEAQPELAIDNGTPLHFLIEGDNLASLQILKKTHKGKVDLIYIDPPYNTGAANWVYDNNYVGSNDLFRHSKWLSMMKKRLALAKPLLKKDGVLICAIDENESATLRLLLEEIFGTGYEYDCVTIVHNPRGIQGKNFSYTNEFAYFVIPKGERIIGQRRLAEEEIYWSSLRNWGGESLRSDAKNCFYPIYVRDGKVVGFGPVCPDDVHPRQNEPMADGTTAVYPVDGNGTERKWRYARQSVEEIAEYLTVKKTRGCLEILIGKPYGTYKTVWSGAKYDANGYGKQLLNGLLPECQFDFPKSLYNVYDCLYAVVGQRKDAVILDFFAGSGTTGHAVMKLNADDGGNRRFILCTNNEGNICREVTYPRIRSAMEQEGYAGSLQFYKVGFLPIQDRLYYEYCHQLLAHIRELTVLENGEEPGDGSIAILLTEEEQEAFFADPNRIAACRRVYRNQELLPTAEQERILAAHQIRCDSIPDCYYPEFQEQ